MGERPTPYAPHPGRRRPPRAPSCRPHSAQSQLARARAVGLVTGPHARIPPHPQPVGSGPRQPAQRAGSRGWESARPRTPHTQARGAPPESAQGPSLPPPEGAPRGRTVLCCEGQAPSPVVHPGHPASPALSLPRVRAPAAPPYPPRVLVTVPMCEGTSSGLRLDAGAAACGGP